MFRLQMIGNLGKDAEVRVLDSGSSAISFSIAHTEKWQSNGETKERTTWVNCTIWRGKDVSTKIADYLKKGQKVLIEGEPSARGWSKDGGEAQASLECRVINVELLGKNDAGTGSADQGSTQSSSNAGSKVTTKPGDDDDLPF